MVTIYQINSKGQKVAKIVAKSLAEGLKLLYRGLTEQEERGKRWLTLAKGRPIFVEGMHNSAYQKVQQIVPARWTMEQAEAAIQYLLK